MALKILSEACINCGVCEPVCPTEAIYASDDFYVIDPDRCTECVLDGTNACVDVCPVDCIELDPEHAETYDQRLARYRRLKEED